MGCFSTNHLWRITMNKTAIIIIIVFVAMLLWMLSETFTDPENYKTYEDDLDKDKCDKNKKR